MEIPLLNLACLQATKSPSLFRVLMLKKVFCYQVWRCTLFYMQNILSVFRDFFQPSFGRLTVTLGSYATEVWAHTSTLAATPPQAHCNSYQRPLTQQLIITIFQHCRIIQRAYCTLIKYFSHLSAVTDFPIFLISFKWSSTNSFGTAVLREGERKKKKEVMKSGANIL